MSVRARDVNRTPPDSTISSSDTVAACRRYPFSVRVPAAGVVKTWTSFGQSPMIGMPHSAAAEKWLSTGLLRDARAAAITCRRYRS